MDSNTKARRDKEDPKHTEALAATAKKKIYLSEVAVVAENEDFTAATLLYSSNDIGKLEACLHHGGRATYGARMENIIYV